MTVENEKLSQIVMMFFEHLRKRGMKFRPGAMDSAYKAGLSVWGANDRLLTSAITTEAQKFMIQPELKMPWGKLVNIKAANSGARA